MNVAGKKIPPAGAVAAGAGLIGVVVYFRRKASASPSPAGSVDPLTGLPTSMDSQVDPVTGLTYLTEAQQYGSVSAAEAALAQGGYLGSGGSPYSTSGTATGTPTPSTTTTVGSYPSNAAWAQAVQAGLAQLGYAQTDIAAALGLFLGRQPLPANYASIVQAAEAEYGPPPVGTYSIVPEPSTASGGGSGSGPIGAPGRPRAVSVASGSAVLAWDGVKGATGYRVRAWEATTAHPIVADVTTTGTSVTIGGLKPRTKYGWHAWSDPNGAWTPNEHFTTT